MSLLALLHHQGALPLSFLHLGLLIAICLPQAAVKNLGRSIMHLLPAMEAPALAQSADSVGERMVNVMEQHLVPAVLATQNHGHDIVQHWPGTARILREELVPGKGVREVGDEHPGRGEPNAGKE